MAGAPSQLDLFSHKPKLNELDGKPLPELPRLGGATGMEPIQDEDDT